MPTPREKGVRLKDQVRPQDVSITNTVGNPFSARPPRPTKSSINFNALSGLSSTLGSILEQSRQQEEQEGLVTQEALLQQAEAQGGYKALIEREGLPESGSVAINDRWRSTTGSALGRELLRRIADRTTELEKEVGRDGHFGDLNARLDEIERDELSKIEEEEEGFLASQAVGAASFYDVFNSSRETVGSGGSRDRLLARLSRAQEASGDIAVRGETQANFSELINAAVFPASGAVGGITTVSKKSLEAFQQYASGLSRDYPAPKVADLLSSGLINALQEAADEVDPETGNPLRTGEEIEELGRAIADEIVIEVPFEKGKPGRRKKVDLLRHGLSGPGLVRALNTFGDKKSVDRRIENANTQSINLLPEISELAQSKAQGDSLSPVEIDRDVTKIISSVVGGDDVQNQILFDKVRREYTARLDSRTNRKDDQKKTTDRNTLILLQGATTTIETQDIYQAAIDSGAVGDPEKIYNAMLRRNTYLGSVQDSVESDEGRDQLNDAIAAQANNQKTGVGLNNFTAWKQKLEAQANKMEMDSTEGLDPLEARAALKALHASPEWEALVITGPQERAVRLESDAQEARNTIRQLENSGAVSALLEKGELYVSEGLITSQFLDSRLLSSDQIADRSGYRTKSILGSNARMVEVVSKAMLSPDFLEGEAGNRVAGILAATEESIFGATSIAEGALLESAAIRAKIAHVAEGRYQQLVSEVISDDGVVGVSAKKNAINTRMREWTTRLTKQLTGVSLGALDYKDLGEEEYTKIIDKVVIADETQEEKERLVSLPGASEYDSHVRSSLKMHDRITGEENIDPDDIGTSFFFDGDRPGLINNPQLPSKFQGSGLTDWDFYVDRSRITFGFGLGSTTGPLTAPGTLVGNQFLYQIGGANEARFPWKELGIEDTLVRAIAWARDPHKGGANHAQATGYAAYVGAIMLLERDNSASWTGDAPQGSLSNEDRNKALAQTILATGVPIDVMVGDGSGLVSPMGLSQHPEGPLTGREVESELDVLRGNLASLASQHGLTKFNTKSGKFQGGSLFFKNEQEKIIARRIETQMRHSSLYRKAKNVTKDPYKVRSFSTLSELKSWETDPKKRARVKKMLIWANEKDVNVYFKVQREMFHANTVIR